MDQVAAVEYRRAAARGRWLALLAVALALAAMVVAAPGLPGWLAGAVWVAPLAALAALALFTLPGLALLRLLHPTALPAADRLVYAVGLSCAVPPLLLLAGGLVGLRWGPWSSWAFLMLCAVVAFWPPRRPAPGAALARFDLAGALLLLLAGLGLLARLYDVRELVAGQFGDSYHHTVIAQLMVEHGGLFHSWQPYVPLTTFTYHFGFHSLVAWLHWLSGYPVTAGVVAVGQILGAASAPLVGLLAARLTGDRRAAVWTTLVVALLSLYPAYYVNWGRYTQLAGQTLLPAAALAWIGLLDQATDREVRWAALGRPALLAALATAGLILTHYRVGVFAASFVVVYALYLLATRVRTWRTWARLVGAGAVAGTAAVLLALPWLLNVRAGMLLRLASYFLSTNVAAEGANSFAPIDVERAVAGGLPPLAALGLIALIARRQWGGLVLPGWAALTWLVANPQLLGLTGAGLISAFAVLIAAYLVLGPLAGCGLTALGDAMAWGLDRLAPGGGRSAAMLAQLFAGTLLVVWGLGVQTRVVDPAYALLRPADLAAMTWVREHLPPDARVFVNSAPAFGDTIYVGTDGGWWLSFLTGHTTNIDPITYAMEASEEPDYQLAVIERNQAVLRHPVASPEAVAALRAQGYSYLYDGPAANPPVEYLHPAALDASPSYESVYRHDGVTIWRLR